MKSHNKLMHHSKRYLALLAIGGFLLAPLTVFGGSRVSINQGWQFYLLDADVAADYSGKAIDTTNWSPVSLPHTANVEPQLVNDQWQGICWYRKTLDVPTSYIGKKLILEFEGAMNYSQVWINGQKVSDHHGGYLPVVIDATNYLKVGQSNTIAVRLDNTDNDITGPKPLNILDFNMYGGLYRNAWLIVKDPVHISHPILANEIAGGGIFISTPKVSQEESRVKVKTHLVNESDTTQALELRQSIYYSDLLVSSKSVNVAPIMPGADLHREVMLTVSDAQLWSPKVPHLYHLKTELLVSGEVVDSETTRFGIRTFEFRDTDFYLNGEKTYLRGVNRHQEYPFVGYALSDNAQYRDAKKIKDAGFDYIRLSHYPHSPAFMRACDVLGIIVIDAILGWQYYNDTDAFRNYCYRSATNLIRRDRNHACVAIWEVSLNETKMPIYFMEELDRIVHAEFPGENVYSGGWMHEVYDVFFQARQHRILHGYHPEVGKPYMVSEYGDWEYYSRNAGLNQHSLSKEVRLEMSSRQERRHGEKRLLQQAYNWQESLNDNMQTMAFGDGYWVMYDYNRGYHDDIEASGLMDFFRLPKFGFHFYASQQSPLRKTVTKLATYWNEESPLEVKVFSNTDEVALYLNGKLVELKAPDACKNSTHLPHPPFTFKVDAFAPGTLKAIGLIDGVRVSEDVVRTPEKAVRLELSLDTSGKAPEAGVNDVLFLYIAAVDANGTVVPDYAGAIGVQLPEGIELMNVDSLNAEAGIATALIQIGESAGNYSIQATAQGLEGEFVLNL